MNDNYHDIHQMTSSVPSSKNSNTSKSSKLSEATDTFDSMTLETANCSNTGKMTSNLLIKLTLGLIGMFAFFQVYSVQAILAVLMSDFSISEVQAGGLVGATVLGIAMMSPITGMLSDAFGRKRLIVMSLFLLAIPTALMSNVSNHVSMTLLRFLQGVSVPGITVVTIAYIGEEFKDSTVAKLMAFYVAGTVLGGFLGRFVLGHLQEWIGWRNAFLIMGAVTFAGGLWVAWQLPASKRFVANPNVRTSMRMLVSHARNKYVLSACLLGFCVLFSLIGCFTFINLYLAEKPYQLSSGQLGTVFAVYLLGVIVTPLSARLVNRFGLNRTVILAIFFSIFGLLLTLSTPLWMIVLGLAVMSSGIFVTQSSTISYIAMNVQQGRSLASGLYYLCYYIGGGVGAWVCGLAYQQGQWQAVIVSILIMQLLAIVIASKLMTSD